LVAIAGSYFIFRDNLKKNSIPDDFEQVHQSYLSCLEEQTLLGISLLESQGGYIDLPDFEAGSRYMPFSSYLTFMGFEIPYWYYISGNNIPKQQVPTLFEMEDSLGNFLIEVAGSCRGEESYLAEYSISTEQPSVVNINIENNNVKVNLLSNFLVSRGEQSYSFGEHSLSVNSKLGELYTSAIELYEQEMEEMFLENYTFDSLVLYAPVDGVELSCKPLVWDAGEVIENLSEAVSANVMALKTEGKAKDYFVVETGIKNSARFISSPDWPSAYEIAPAEGGLLVADPIGNQQGMGILGFCYVPYHFVYDVRYPVLIQVYEGDEIFQFPFAVILDNNRPRKGLKPVEPLFEEQESICDGPTFEATVALYDSDLKAIDGRVFYECFSSRCDLGETENGELTASFPRCFNGNLVINAEGFAEFSMIKEGVVLEGEQIITILDREFSLDVGLISSGEGIFDQAIISFSSEEGKYSTIIYPDQKEVFLSEGEYDISVEAYGESSIVLGNTTYEQCVDGFFLGIGKKCYDVEVPAESFDRALIGGGKTNILFSERNLESSSKVVLDVGELNVPEDINELQDNYILVESRKLGVELR